MEKLVRLTSLAELGYKFKEENWHLAEFQFFYVQVKQYSRETGLTDVYKYESGENNSVRTWMRLSTINSTVFSKNFVLCCNTSEYRAYYSLHLANLQ